MIALDEVNHLAESGDGNEQFRDRHATVHYLPYDWHEEADRTLTRPLRASFGDLLSQPVEYGGMGFGTVAMSLTFLGVIVAVVAWMTAAHEGEERPVIDRRRPRPRSERRPSGMQAAHKSAST
ncbi:MAG: hypothetical protein U1E40_09090 [Amaricoccus sp.]